VRGPCSYSDFRSYHDFAVRTINIDQTREAVGDIVDGKQQILFFCYSIPRVTVTTLLELAEFKRGHTENPLHRHSRLRSVYHARATKC